MAKKYGLSKSISSTADATGRVSDLPLYATSKDRFTFVAEFEDIRPDEAFSTLDYDGGVQRQVDYNYGPMVAFIKKFTINIKDDIEYKDEDTELVQFKINDVELNSEQYTISRSDDETTFTIEHERPPLKSQLDTSGKTAWVDYVDPADSDPTKFKYFLFDPVEITIRAKYNKSFLDSLSEEAKTQLSQRVPKIEEEYDISNYSWDEITPIRLYDYWLTERVEYLFRFNYSGSFDCISDVGDIYFFPSPFWLYQNHLPDESWVYPVGRSVTITGLIASIMLQHMRFASYYSQHRTSDANDSISVSDMKKMFGRGWDLGGGNLDLISWDGVALEPIFDNNGNPAGFKQPKGKYVKLGSSPDIAPICYGCNRHPNWTTPMEQNRVLECVDTKFCEELERPRQVIDTIGPMSIEDIPRESPEIEESETGYMTGIGRKPDYPTVIKREHFDRFFLLFSNVNIPPDLSHYMYLHLKESIRVVPVRSDMSRVLGSDNLAGHVEICPRRSGGNGVITSSTDDIDGTKLSKLEFGVTDQEGDTRIVEDDRYPYRFRSIKNYRDQFRTVLTDWHWDKLNMVKVYTVPNFPVRIQTKRAYKSLDYIRSAVLYVVEERTYGGGGGGSITIGGGDPPGGRSRKCCNYVVPMPGSDCRCPAYSTTFWSDPSGSRSTWHYFAVFSNPPIPDWMLKDYAIQLGLNKSWGMFVRPGDLPRGARVKVPLITGIGTHRHRIAGSTCAPSYIGPNSGNYGIYGKTFNIPLDDMDPDAAQSLIESLTESAVDNPCFELPILNGSNDIIVGYASKTFRVGSEGSSSSFQWIGDGRYIPGTWCQEDLTPGYIPEDAPLHFKIEDWRPGRVPFSENYNYLYVNAGGDWTNTFASNSTVGGWFDYNFHCNHTFTFVEGEYSPCRYNECL